MHDVHVCMQATAEAIVEGNCLSADAIAEVLVESSAEISADSTCGMTATAFEFDPNEDGPVEGPSEAPEVAGTPLEDAAEEERANVLLKALLDRTPVDDSAAGASLSPLPPTTPFLQSFPPREREREICILSLIHISEPTRQAESRMPSSA